VKRVALVALTGCGVLSTFVLASRQGPPHDPAAVFVSRDVYLMGTRAQLSAYAATRDTGLARLESALAVLEETEDELSTWRESSEISALNRQPVGEPWMADARLCRMFADVWDWHSATGRAFDPAIGRLLAAWDVHGEGAVPAPDVHARALASSGMALVAFDPGRCTLTRRADVAFDVGAFGKGEALDRAAAALGDGPWMIDLGGQISVGGRLPPKEPVKKPVNSQPPTSNSQWNGFGNWELGIGSWELTHFFTRSKGGWTVAVADPRRRDRPALHVRMATGSLSTSAGSERDLFVNGVRIAHHFDPRTGLPASFDGSVTVWHTRGLAADALSTALYVMGPEAGLRWAEARGIAACYLIPDRGALRVEATRAFEHLRIDGLTN
jgi:FAD:protein FMN transferase